MKTLKFMLAAATAIGLASASQAAGPYDGSTDFESDTLNSTITTSGPYWTVPTGAEDGDYTIVSGVPSSALRSAGATSAFTTAPAQVLQLEGGTDPLTRNIKASGSTIDLTDGEVYIDTLVQFTVTPAGDTVTAGASDKLLIYLQEDLTEGSETTNIVVKTCSFSAEVVPGTGDELTVTNINTGVGAPTVVPGEWYRLTVKSTAVALGDDRYLPVFTIKIGNTQLSAGTPLANNAPDQTLFPSILGATASPTIASVGFAGSGAVDDLLFTTFNPDYTVVDFYLALVDDNNPAGIPGDVSYSTSGDSGTLGSAALTTAGQQIFCAYDANNGSPSVTVTYTLSSGFIASWSNGTTANGNDTFVPAAGTKYTLTVTPEITTVDFTFALGTGVSAIKWVVGDVTNTVSTATATASADADATITIAEVTYGDWYVADTASLHAGSTVTATAGATYSVNAQAVGKASGEIDVPAGTTAADLGISNAAFASDTPEQLTKLAAWAKAKNVAMSTINDTTAMSFDPETQAAKAFLLNCANTAADVEAAEAAFKFNAITPGTVPAIEGAANYNGTVTVKGGATLDAITVTPATSEHKFYKATLTK